MNKILLSIIVLFATVIVTNNFCMEKDEIKILTAEIIGGNKVRRNLIAELKQEKQNIKNRINALPDLEKPSPLCYCLATYLPYLNFISGYGFYALANAYLPPTDKKEIIASTISVLGSASIQKLCDRFFVSKIKEYKKKLKENEKRQNWHDARAHKIDEILKSKTLELEVEPKLGEE